MLTWMDGTWGKESPLNTVGKLSAIATKTKGQLEYARWIVACVKDRILSKQSSLNDGWSEELLTGSRDKSSKGIIDLCMYKLDMKTYLLGGFLESHPSSPRPRWICGKCSNPTKTTGCSSSRWL